MAWAPCHVKVHDVRVIRLPLPVPVESNLGASCVNLIMSKYTLIEEKACETWHCVHSRGSNSILKKWAVVGDVHEG